MSDERREAVAAVRARGAPLEDDSLATQDGERPRKRWHPVAGSAILPLLALVNPRALLKRAAA